MYFIECSVRKEGDHYVTTCSTSGISSFGKSVGGSIDNLIEAMELNLDKTFEDYTIKCEREEQTYKGNGIAHNLNVIPRCGHYVCSCHCTHECTCGARLG